jgi:hypothetical protein
MHLFKYIALSTINCGPKKLAGAKKKKSPPSFFSYSKTKKKCIEYQMRAYKIAVLSNKKRCRWRQIGSESNLIKESGN